MKQITPVGFALMLGLGVAFGQQDYKRVEPNVPKKKAPEVKLSQAAEAEVDGSDEVVIPRLNGLVIVGSTNDYNPSGVSGVTGLQVRGPDVLKKSDFASVVAPYLGQPVSERKIKMLQRDIIVYCRSKDHPVIDAYYPIQTVEGGVVQMIVLVGRLGQVRVTNPGTKWFSDEFVKSNIKLKPGEPVRESKLLKDVNWLNRNPYFREVNVAFQQGALGETDVDLRVRDRFPLRVYAGYDDSGSKIVGDHRVFAGFNWGNVFGLDHQLNYQYTSDIEFKYLSAHSASYIIPLPWRHTLTFFGSYSDVTANLAKIGFAPLSQKGESYQASVRYTVPLPQVKKFSHELSAGFDYKGSDFRIDFGGIPVFNTPTEIGQWVLGYRALLVDTLGATTLNAEGFYSPGGMFGANKDFNFRRTRPGSSADYVYGRFELQRGTKLPFTDNWQRKALDDCFSWFVHGIFQISEANLLPSEQLGIGGWATVRGYDERLGNGDQGLVVINELRTPAYRIGNLFQSPNGVDTLQFLAFTDYGTVQVKHATPGFDPHVNLWSVGGGVRLNLSRHLTVRFDYGFQLSEKALSRAFGLDTSRGHVSAVVSF